MLVIPLIDCLIDRSLCTSFYRKIRLHASNEGGMWHFEGGAKVEQSDRGGIHSESVDAVCDGRVDVIRSSCE